MNRTKLPSRPLLRRSLRPSVTTDPPTGLANFDSSTTSLRALAHCLHGEDFPALGIAPRSLSSIVPVGNRLPKSARQRLYRFGSAQEAINPEGLGTIRIEAFRQWVVEQYPDREYPAVMIGSSNGAGIYLAALLGIPWLPQNFLLPVRRNVHPDAPNADIEWASRAAGPLLAANDDIHLHQMNDPNQDRIPISVMAYFRIKSIALGRAYEQFLDRMLAPDGTIVVLDCQMQWPKTAVGDRHTFQFGGVGGIEPGEYQAGSDRIERFLAADGSPRRRWHPPQPTDERPEAEWGFESTLLEDINRYAADRDHSVSRMQFDHPNDLSPVVSELYRKRYHAMGIPPTRLVVTTFAQMDPWWTLRTGSVPFWLSFVTEPDADALEAYLTEEGDRYNEVFLSLFSHGVESIGLASIDRWRTILERANGRGNFLGVDPDEFPVDFGTYVRYNQQFPRKISDRYPLASPMPFDRFLDQMTSHTHSQVRWIEPP